MLWVGAQHLHPMPSRPDNTTLLAVTYRGWVVSISANGANLTSWSTAGERGAVWSPEGVSTDGQYLYVGTGMHSCSSLICTVMHDVVWHNMQKAALLYVAPILQQRRGAMSSKVIIARQLVVPVLWLSVDPCYHALVPLDDMVGQRQISPHGILS